MSLAQLSSSSCSQRGFWSPEGLNIVNFRNFSSLQFAYGLILLCPEWKGDAIFCFLLLLWNHDQIYPGRWSCQDRSGALSEESLVTEFCLKVSVIQGITEIIFSPLGLGRSSHPVAQGVPCICSHVEVMGFWQLFSRVFSFLNLVGVITLISTSVEIVLLEMNIVIRMKSLWWVLLKLKSLNSAKLLTLGKCILIQSHCYPLAPCRLEKVRDVHSQRGWHLCAGPAEMVLIPHVFQPYFPQCARGVLPMLSSGQTLLHPWLLGGSAEAENLAHACAGEAASCSLLAAGPLVPNPAALLKRFRFSPWCCQTGMVQRCSRALSDLQGWEASPGVTMLVSFIGLPVGRVVSRLSWICLSLAEGSSFCPGGWGKAVLCTSPCCSINWSR